LFIFAPILATLATLASVVANANLNTAHERRSRNLYGYRQCHFYLLAYHPGMDKHTQELKQTQVSVSPMKRTNMSLCVFMFQCLSI
jgi:hypothetical protein